MNGSVFKASSKHPRPNKGRHGRLIAAFALASGLALTACSGGDGDPVSTPTSDGTAAGSTPSAAGTTAPGEGGGEGQVTMWMYPVIPDEDASRAYWQDVESEFETAHPAIDLVIELNPWDARDEKIATAIAGKQGPDLVLLTADQTLNYQSTGGLKPLTGAVEEERDNFLPAALDSVTHDGEVYGVPLYLTSTTTMYNKKLFEDAGITEMPETWDEIKAAAPALAENGVAVMDYSGSPNMTLNLSFYPLLWQAGGSVFTEDGTDIAFDGPEGVEALQFLMDLKEMGGLPEDAAVKENAVEGGGLGNGTIAMGYANVKPEVEAMITAHGEENIVVGSPLMHKEQVSFGTPGVLALTTINENEEAAFTVAKFLSSVDTVAGLHKASGTYPARTDAPSPGDDEITQAFVDALEFARPGEVVPNARQVMAALQPHLQSALQGQVTAEEALSAAATEARSIIQRAG